METGFSNINAIMHPAGMLGNVGWIEKTSGDFLYYREGITPVIGAWIDAVDQGPLEIVRRLGLQPLRFVDIFHQAGLTTAEARDSGSAYRRYITASRTLQSKSPPSLDHRYIREDVGYGLVPMAEVGKLLGVRTPVMDALIHAGVYGVGEDFRRDGLTLDKMGLVGITAGDAAGPACRWLLGVLMRVGLCFDGFY